MKFVAPSYRGQTAKINNGNVAVKQVTKAKELKPLFVLFAYGGKGSNDFLAAAKFKEKRLKKTYPNGKVLPIIEGFKYPSHFKKEWSKLYKNLITSGITKQYSLWQVHYFGHGGPMSLYLEKEGGIKGANSEIFFEGDIKERLPWHPDKGIFVLHSCRGAAFEDTENKNKINNQICLAKTISEKQLTRCLGQTFYASFCTDRLSVFANNTEESEEAEKVLKTTAEEDAKRFIFRDKMTKNIRPGSDKVLWAYATLNGETYNKMMTNKTNYENVMKKKDYPIYHQVKKLAHTNEQIFPCRIFKNGNLVHDGIVARGVINKEDLEYI